MGFVKLNSKRVIEACNSYISFVDAYKKNEIEKAIKKKMIPTTKSFLFGLWKRTKVMTREEAEKAIDMPSHIFKFSERELIMDVGINPYNVVMSIKSMAEEAEEVFLSEAQVELIKHDLNLLKG